MEFPSRQSRVPAVAICAVTRKGLLIVQIVLLVVLEYHLPRSLRRGDLFLQSHKTAESRQGARHVHHWKVAIIVWLDETLVNGIV